MKPMSKIVRSVADLMYPFIAIFGFYLIVHGHLTPGGGFQGGAIVASAFAMIIVAYGTTKKFNRTHLSLTESSGLLLFIGVAFLALFVGSAFFINDIGIGPVFGDSVSDGDTHGNMNTGGIIPILNIAVGLEVAAALCLILVAMADASGLSGLPPPKLPDEEEDGGDE